MGLCNSHYLLEILVVQICTAAAVNCLVFFYHSPDHRYLELLHNSYTILFFRLEFESSKLPFRLRWSKEMTMQMRTIGVISKVADLPKSTVQYIL